MITRVKSSTPNAPTITFTEEETTKVIQLYNDVLYLTLHIANHNVCKVLVDSGILVDIFFCPA